MHKVIKYTKGGKQEHEDVNELGGWHLNAQTGDGEFTACGNSIVDYDHTSKEVNKGGVTCPDCLELIRYYKSVKL